MRLEYSVDLSRVEQARADTITDRIIDYLNDDTDNGRASIREIIQNCAKAGYTDSEVAYVLSTRRMRAVVTVSPTFEVILIARKRPA